ncbi:helix-turn-helix domain-containing protein [Aeromonas hydrophila]|uniref:helix-turn-helix domain-containing protein n=1 Tax=Aeromonas hydrophila TaxID=644 RepID=UPI001269306E|nr:helix-turn-helix transcriptional regulator [Aeromonas hydrophila]
MVEKKVSYAAVVGAVLFEERERRNVSQAAAANVAGLTQSTWARMELGRACTLENLAKASEAFRFELWQLLRVVDDRVRGLKEQGVVVIYELPVESEIKEHQEEWLTSSSLISKMSLIGLGALAGAAMMGVAEYIKKAPNK